MSVHDWLLATWYGGSGRGRWLQPLAACYAAAERLRRALYRRAWLGTYRSPRAVIVVGNLTVGGTGKTPFVAWLAGGLARRGHRIGVASRGYGRKDARARLVHATDSALAAGDEPVLLLRRLGVPVAVATRRREAVRLLEPTCDAIVCDDGLQHVALARDYEIAVVDGARGLGNGRLLPAGPLREEPTRLEHVDTVVVNGPGFEQAGAVRMRLEPRAAVSLHDGSRRPLAEFAGRTVVAAAAIGHPERFFSLLRAQGIEVLPRPFPDHVRIDPAALSRPAGMPVLMTEKDAVKCDGARWRDAWYVPVEAEVEEPDASALLDRVDAVIRRKTRKPE